jgi:hypothetical protein
VSTTDEDPQVTEDATRAAREAEQRLTADDDKRLSDPKQVLGSKHYASVLAFGTFQLAAGGSVVCLGVQGVSAVTTAAEADHQEGRPTAHLTRLMTHFDWPEPTVLIEQNPYRESYGTLTGDGADLLPGTASFSQFLILTLNGKPLVNPAPLVMSARGVTRWPPIGSVLESEGAAAFYAVDDLPVAAALGDPHAFADATPTAHLLACKAATISEVSVPTVQELGV